MRRMSRAAVAVPAVSSDLLELTKPRITLLVSVTTAAGFLLALPPGRFPLALFVHAVRGTGLVAAGSAVLNQYVERDLDARMRRAARRPLPAGRREPPTRKSSSRSLRSPV